MSTLGSGPITRRFQVLHSFAGAGDERRTINDNWSNQYQHTHNTLPPAGSQTALMHTRKRPPTYLEQEIDPLPILHHGETFAGFTIERRLGAGGMGEVYQAHSPIFGRAALKVSSRDMTDEAFNTALLSGARYRNLAKFVDSGTVEIDLLGFKVPVAYLATALIEGKTLKEILLKGAMPPVDAVRIGRSLSSAAGVMHQRGLVHNDIKPTNVIIEADGEAVLFDYGLSKAHPIPRREDGRVFGTPFYMSPEQISCSEIGPATDVFSLGITLWETLTGKVDEELERARYWEVLKKGYAPLPPLPYWVDAGLQDIINKATARKPEGRYPDGHALARALAEV